MMEAGDADVTEKAMTQDEFIKSWTDGGKWKVAGESWSRSGPWGIQNAEGRIRILLDCKCGSSDCPGWAMVSPPEIERHIYMDMGLVDEPG